MGTALNNDKLLLFLFFLIVGMMPKIIKIAYDGKLIIFSLYFIVSLFIVLGCVYIWNNYLDLVKKMEKYFKNKYRLKH